MKSPFAVTHIVTITLLSGEIAAVEAIQGGICGHVFAEASEEREWPHVVWGRGGRWFVNRMEFAGLEAGDEVQIDITPVAGHRRHGVSATATAE